MRVFLDGDEIRIHMSLITAECIMAAIEALKPEKKTLLARLATELRKLTQ
jgi:hypothetical protein